MGSRATSRGSPRGPPPFPASARTGRTIGGRRRDGKGGRLRARAVSFVAPRRVEVGEVELAEPGHDDVVVRTLYSGISAGTELLAYRGELPPGLPLDEKIDALPGTFAYPFRYGYSCVGAIERGGGLTEGSVVFAFHPHQDRFTVPAGSVVPVPGVEPRVATLFPLVETALQVSLDAGPLAEEDVVVVGLGVVGILVAALLQRAGARVLAAEPRAGRREAARAFGVRAVPPAELEAAVMARTEGRGVPLLVEATGEPAALAGALSLLAHEGTALVASWYGTREAPLPLGRDFHRRRLTIRSSQVSTIPARLTGRWTVGRRRAVVRRLLDELPLVRLVTHEFPLSRAPEAFATLDRGDEEVLHVALSYDP
jgi:2-desacetyl-2-hydroxyethyl bacteriochlorophyllide A dehydrogenase